MEYNIYKVLLFFQIYSKKQIYISFKDDYNINMYNYFDDIK